MTTNDELARLRSAFAEPEGPAPEPEACPPSDRIWLAVRGELPPDGLREVVDHVAACPACAEDWRIAMVFEEEARAAGSASPERIRPTRRGIAHYRAWMAVAATILVAVVGLRLHQPGPRPQEPVFRSGQTQAVEMLVPDGAPVSRRSCALTWKATPDAASYRLRVTDAALNTLYEDGVAATAYTVPESALAGLAPGTKLYWAVTPVSRDGAEMQSQTATRSILLSD